MSACIQRNAREQNATTVQAERCTWEKHQTFATFTRSNNQHITGYYYKTTQHYPEPKESQMLGFSREIFFFSSTSKSEDPLQRLYSYRPCPRVFSPCVELWLLWSSAREQPEK